MTFVVKSRCHVRTFSYPNWALPKRLPCTQYTFFPKELETDLLKSVVERESRGIGEQDCPEREDVLNNPCNFRTKVIDGKLSDIGDRRQFANETLFLAIIDRRLATFWNRKLCSTLDWVAFVDCKCVFDCRLSGVLSLPIGTIVSLRHIIVVQKAWLLQPVEITIWDHVDHRITHLSRPRVHYLTDVKRLVWCL